MPLAPSAGVKMNAMPLQTVNDTGVIAGRGLTVTAIIKAEPEHPPLEGVTVYVAVLAELVVLTRFPVMFNAPVPAAPPVKPAPAGAAQVYVVPAGIMPLVPSTGVIVKLSPVQTEAAIALIAGAGFIVMVTVKEGPV